MTTQKVNISAIDRALAAAKARKAAKEGTDGEHMPKKAEKAGPKLNSEEKAAAKTLREQQKAAAKAERDAAREARKQERAAAREAKRQSSDKPAHMKKVDRAFSKLPSLNEATQLIFNEATCNLSAQQLDALAQHVLHYNRKMATVNAMSSQMLRIGDTVRVTGGDPKFIGMVGKVVKSRQLRAKIEVPGQKNLVYIFTGQAEIIEANSTVAVAV